VNADICRAPISSDVTAAFWLKQLKEAHADLISATNELARLTSGPVPAKDLLVSVRWKVSKASLERRLLWGRIHAQLSGSVDAKSEDDLRHLQKTDMQLFRGSTAHVAKWTADAIIEDWRGYCSASEAMRSKMIDAIGTEERLLYPILEAAEAHLRTC
jgi:hypothetical protein